jgi:hypothetical protein
MPTRQTLLMNSMKTNVKMPNSVNAPIGRVCCAIGWLLGSGLSLILLPATHAADSGEIVAVSSRLSDDYVRSKLPDGSFETENYTFGEGGHWGGAIQDDSIDKLKFMQVARTIAPPLAARKYLPARDPAKTKLLIMVYWGTTMGASGTEDSVAAQNLSRGMQHLRTAQDAVKAQKNSGVRPSGTDKLMALTAQQAALAELDNALVVSYAEEHDRDRTNLMNARMLGYNASGMIGTDYGQWLEFTALHSRSQDLIDEIEDNRYFVVLMAYDFQVLLKEKKHKLLWETRYSIRQRGNEFDRQLAAMTEYASKYFGEDTHGLLRKPLPEGHVTLGKLEVGEVVPDK